MTLTPTALNVPPASTPQRGQLFVVYSGLITTALTLFGVFWIGRQTDDFNIMGWYANYVIPIGALIVGVAAGSGYGIGSAMNGLKISGRMMLAVLALQVVAYFIAQYIEYRELVRMFASEGEGIAIGFWQYFHLSAISFAWKNKGGGMGEPLGYWGYAFRALEIAGFALGGLIVPGFMRSRPYCDTCRRYMKSRELGAMAASVPARKVKKGDAAGTAAYEDEQQRAMEAGVAWYEGVRDHAGSGDTEALRGALAPIGADAKAADKLPSRIKVSLVHCPGCNAGRLVSLVVTGKGENAKVDPLPKIELPPDAVTAIVRS